MFSSDICSSTHEHLVLELHAYISNNHKIMIRNGVAMQMCIFRVACCYGQIMFGQLLSHKGSKGRSVAVLVANARTGEMCECKNKTIIADCDGEKHMNTDLTVLNPVPLLRTGCV